MIGWLSQVSAIHSFRVCGRAITVAVSSATSAKARFLSFSQVQGKVFDIKRSLIQDF
jgi:hypothetical protein